jgi:hypothetical protein
LAFPKPVGAVVPDQIQMSGRPFFADYWYQNRAGFFETEELGRVIHNVDNTKWGNFSENNVPVL